MMILSLAGFMLVVLFGYIVVNIFQEKAIFLEKVSLGFVIGFGLFSYVLFLANLRGIRFGLLQSSIILFMLIGIFYLINIIFKRKFILNFDIRRYLVKFISSFKKLSLPGKISFVFIFFIVISVIVYDLYWPLRGTDTFALYDFRAKSFVATGFMNDALARGNFISYPLMTSLSHTWLYLIGFSNPLFFYAIFYISFVILLYCSFRKILNTNLSMIFTAIFCAFPDFYSLAQVSYTNLPYATYLVLGGIYLYLGMKLNKNGLIILSMIIIALSGWTRSIEPFWVVSLIVALLYGIYRPRNIFISLIYVLFVYVFRTPWNFFYQSNSIGIITIQSQIEGGTSMVISGLSQNMHLGLVINYVFMYGVKPFLPLYILSIILIIYKIVFKSKDWWFVLILIGTSTLLFLGTYIFSFSFPEWINIPSSFKRLAINIVPMMLFFVATFMAEYQNNLKLGMQIINKKVKLDKLLAHDK